ncbi:MAG: hypothetical protein E6629_06800 [Anaerococcus vaginalis]|uniref:hypothetical protein n=1 Tax=Anaerococcus vaginalis TaxID=33037 RepID=UPI002910EF1C|nr:hypothetical protein [Anaerococcus vaginalis]MDU6182354.1 hypothetical protein [Anaerococcus vaginalis]
MEVFLINSNIESELDFIKEFSKKLSENKSVLLLSFTRNKNENIEDLYDMGGMITYDICDYFLDLIDLDKIIVKACENIDFAIPPLLNSKYQIKKEDISKLLEKINTYDYLIINGLDGSLIDDKKEIQIISENQIEKEIKADYFFINSYDKYFDIREYRDEILGKFSKFLGLKEDGSTYDRIISNILEDKSEDIQKIGFFEKLKKKLVQ